MTMTEITEGESAESAPRGTPGARGRSAVLWVAVHLCIVLLAWAALELWGLGKAPFHTVGEPREGLVVWEMTHHGGWILPRRNGMELPSKPPLFHWLGAITSLLHGATDEWSIRFPSAGLSLLALLCVYAAGAALWTSRAGLLSALALMTMFEWARAATGARVDMTLTFGLQLAFLSSLFFFRHRSQGWLVPLYAGVTLAVLGKGPVGVALPGLAALAVVALSRDLRPLRDMRLGYGAVTVGVLAGSWYVAALVLGGWAFFRKQVLAENIFTFLSNPAFGEGHRHGAWYLFGTLLLGLLPWTLLLPGVGARLWRQRRQITVSDPRVYLLVWIAVVFGFYAVSAAKRSVYLLALYPAVALLLGWWADEQSAALAPAAPAPEAPVGEQRWLARLLAAISWALVGVLGVLALLVLLEGLGVPIVATVRPWCPAAAQPFAPWVTDVIRSGCWPLLGFLVLSGASFYGTTRAARVTGWTAMSGTLFCGVAAATMAVSQIILPGVARHQTRRAFMAEVRQIVGPQQEVSFYHVLDYGAVFYWNAHIPTYDGALSAVAAPRYILLPQEEWDGAQAAAQGHYEEVTFPDREATPDPRRLILIRRVDAGSRD